MATLHVHNIRDQLYEALKALAQANVPQRLNASARVIIEIGEVIA